MQFIFSFCTRSFCGKALVRDERTIVGRRQLVWRCPEAPTPGHSYVVVEAGTTYKLSGEPDARLYEP